MVEGKIHEAISDWEFQIKMEKLYIEELRNKFHKVFPFQEREITLREERIRNYHRWIEEKKQEDIFLSLNSSNL
jgi:hypothetical protein